MAVTNEAKVSFQNKCNLLEAKLLEVEKDRDKVVLEYKTLKDKQEIMNMDRQADQLEISNLKEKLSKTNNSIFLENKILNLKQKRVLKLYIKNVFFRAFKYVYPESLKHEKFGLIRCYKEINMNDEVEKRQYEKSIIQLLNAETSQRRHECVIKVKKSINCK